MVRPEAGEAFWKRHVGGAIGYVHQWVLMLMPFDQSRGEVDVHAPRRHGVLADDASRWILARSDAADDIRWVGVPADDAWREDTR